MTARRILILTNRVPFPLNDGGNLAMHAMIEGFRKAGWEVLLLSMNTTRHYIAKDVLENIYRDIRFETVDINNDVKILPTVWNYLFSRQPNHAKRFNNRAFASKLAETLADFTPDVVQVESVFLTSYLPLIRKHSTALTILRAHNIEYEVWERFAREPRNVFKKIYLRNLAKRISRFEHEAWKQYELVLPITGVDAKTIGKYAAHVLTVPFGIEISAVKDNKTAAWQCYHIGAMDWLPNAEAINWFLQQVWPAIHQAYPHLRFFYAGRNMPESFKNMDVAGAVCEGEVPDADAFIAGKKILIVPLRSGGGIRVKILEAMAAGKIIISTSVGMQGINAIPGIHYIPADDAPAFFKAIEWVLAHKTEAEAIAGNAAKLAKTQYDQQAIMGQLIDKINNLLVTN